MTPLPNILKNASNQSENLIQWSSYDSIDHEITHTGPDHVLSSSFVIRKALIRKHYLARCIHDYLVKMPSSPLQHSTPRTWELDISFADELEEKWADELWDLGEELDTSDKWWILKPGMADRGMGIRLFNNKHMLESIFEEFEESEDLDNGDLEDHKDNTAVVTSQLRHFVIQVRSFCLHRFSC
jgi:tubulin--tyrosine ligase